MLPNAEGPAAHAVADYTAPRIPGDGGDVALALDLGTITGYAIRNRDGVIASGTVSFRPSRYDGGGVRYLRFRT